MPIPRVATALLGAVLACQSVQARTLDQVPEYLKKEGPFVTVPAVGGAALGTGVGAVLALPATLVAGPIGWAAGDPLGYAMVPPSLLGAGGGEVGYHLFGAIPYGLKSAFYDGPMYVVHRIKGDPLSGLVAQVDPPPRLEATPQYLASTPPDSRIPVDPGQTYSNALPPPREPTSMMLRRQLSPFKPPPLPVRAPAAPVVPAPAAAAVAIPAVAKAEPVVQPLEQPALPVPVRSSQVPVAPAESAPAAPAPVAQAEKAAPKTEPEARRRPVEPVPSAVAVPAAADDAATDVEVERPTIKKKRKFSERFRF